MCIYCRINENLTFDHIISLNKGGEHSFLNGVMACNGCNSSKGDKDVFKWCKKQKIEVPEIIVNNLNKIKGG